MRHLLQVTLVICGLCHCDFLLLKTEICLLRTNSRSSQRWRIYKRKVVICKPIFCIPIYVFRRCLLWTSGLVGNEVIPCLGCILEIFYLRPNFLGQEFLSGVVWGWEVPRRGRWGPRAWRTRPSSGGTRPYISEVRVDSICQGYIH